MMKNKYKHKVILEHVTHQKFSDVFNRIGDYISITLIQKGTCYVLKQLKYGDQHKCQ